jgi:hypothetical protein
MEHWCRWDGTDGASVSLLLREGGGFGVAGRLRGGSCGRRESGGGAGRELRRRLGAGADQPRDRDLAGAQPQVSKGAALG